MRNLASIQELYNTISGWDYSDDPECDDAQWAQGALAALRNVLKYPEGEREAKTLDYYNRSMGYVSYGDDDADVYQCGKQETLAYCLNRVSRYLHLDTEDLRADTSGHDDHEFKARNGEGGYLYECVECGWRELPPLALASKNE